MAPRPSSLAILVAAALGAGCHSAAKNEALPSCGVPPCQPGEQPIRIQLPPQKITIEQSESNATTVPPTQLESPKSTETAKDQRKPESARPESAGGRPAGAEAAEAGIGTLAGLGQVASISKTMALTRPLGVNSGSFSLGIGIQWIHIPIPLPRLFAVEETPSITVPLNEANLIPAGYSPAGPRGGEAAVTREAIAAAVAQEIAASRAQGRRTEAAAADDDERKRLEKKLAETEAQVERMSKMLKGLEDKLPPLPPKP